MVDAVSLQVGPDVGYAVIVEYGADLQARCRREMDGQCAPGAESYEPDLLPVGQLDDLSGQCVISGRRVDSRVRELDDLIPRLAKNRRGIGRELVWLGGRETIAVEHEDER